MRPYRYTDTYIAVICNTYAFITAVIAQPAAVERNVAAANVQSCGRCHCADADIAICVHEDTFAVAVAGEEIAVEVERLGGGVATQIVAGYAGQAGAIAGESCCSHSSNHVKS